MAIYGSLLHSTTRLYSILLACANLDSITIQVYSESN